MGVTSLLLPEVGRALADHRRPVPVRVHTGGDDAGALIHPIWLRRIVANLLNNAHQHAGGATAVGVGRTREWAWIAVEDAGHGIPAAEREHIFSRVASPANQSSGQGSHLGLAITREHIRRAGGELSVQDCPGRGARFLLQLPDARHAAGVGHRAGDCTRPKEDDRWRPP